MCLKITCERSRTCLLYKVANDVSQTLIFCVCTNLLGQYILNDCKQVG